MAFIRRNIEFDETAMGPGFLIFFRTTTRVRPANVGPAGSTGTSQIVLEHEEQYLEEDDIFDILALLTLSGLIK